MTRLKLQTRTVTVHPRRTFTITRSSSDAFERVVLELEKDGHTGRGEAAATGYYDQSAAGDAAALGQVRIPEAWEVEGALRENGALSASALSALDAALHDLAARRLGVPVWRMLGLWRPSPQTAYTLGIADLDTTLADLRSLAGHPILKVKVGGRADIETVREVVHNSRAEVWVDANEAFSPEEAPEVCRELAQIGVGMVEQPVAAAAGPEALRRVTEAVHPLPVVADESSLTAKDVPKLAGCVSGVNVKLAKCGGIRRALEMIHTARAHGMRVMLGCMVETSLGIAAALQLASLVDFVDLDGALLLADDPFSGLGFEEGRLIAPPEAPGLGVEPI